MASHLTRRGFGITSAWVIAICVLAGCSGERQLKVYRVTGQVLYNGEPLKKVDVAFHPVDPKNETGYPPHATTDDAGNFTLMTYVKDDGAPAGEFKVCVAFAVESGEDDEVTQSKKLPFQVPKVYHTKESTPIKVTVKPETNALEPFRLEGPPVPPKK